MVLILGVSILHIRHYVTRSEMETQSAQRVVFSNLCGPIFSWHLKTNFGQNNVVEHIKGDTRCRSCLSMPCWVYGEDHLNVAKPKEELAPIYFPLNASDLAFKASWGSKQHRTKRRHEGREWLKVEFA